MASGSNLVARLMNKNSSVNSQSQIEQFVVLILEVDVSACAQKVVDLLLHFRPLRTFGWMRHFLPTERKVAEPLAWQGSALAGLKGPDIDVKNLAGDRGFALRVWTDCLEFRSLIDHSCGTLDRKLILPAR